jgi:hypothetical protein
MTVIPDRMNPPTTTRSNRLDGVVRTIPFFPNSGEKEHFVINRKPKRHRGDEHGEVDVNGAHWHEIQYPCESLDNLLDCFI